MQEREAREKVLLSLHRIMLQDKANHIQYLWGGRTDPDQGFDCSGFIYYTIKQAGIAIDAGCTARGIFKNFTTQLVQLDQDKHIKTAFEHIQQGDVLLWNSIDTEYKRSTGPIPEITKDGKIYRIHHIAFIDKINYSEGTIDIFESNGSQGVTKNTISVHHWLTQKGIKNSQLYVAHIDYSTLEQKKLVP